MQDDGAEAVCARVRAIAVVVVVSVAAATAAADSSRVQLRQSFRSRVSCYSVRAQQLPVVGEAAVANDAATPKSRKRTGASK